MTDRQKNASQNQFEGESETLRLGHLCYCNQFLRNAQGPSKYYVSKNGHFLNQPTQSYAYVINEWSLTECLNLKNTDQYETPCTFDPMIQCLRQTQIRGFENRSFLVLQASIQVEGINRASPLQTQNFAYKMFSFFQRKL